MKWRILLPSLLLILGVWLWQESVLSGLKEREKVLQRSARIQTPPPAVVRRVEATPPPEPPPEANAVARSLLMEYAALLSGRNDHTDAYRERNILRMEEHLAAQSPEVLREALLLIDQKLCPPSTTGTIMFTLLRILGRSDPAACVRYAGDRMDDDRICQCLPGWLKNWSRVDPDAAQRWFDEMKEKGGFKNPRAGKILSFKSGTEEALRVQMLSGRVAFDPAAFDFHQLENMDANAQFRFSADAANILNTPEKREIFARRIWADVSDPNAAEKLLTLAASIWTRRVPFTELKQLTDSLEEPDDPLSAEKQKILSSMRACIVRDAGGAPSDEIYAWALQGATDPALRGYVIGSLVNEWAGSDVNNTGTFINSLPHGPDRDQAILTFTHAVGSFDSEARLTWAASISDPALRRKTLEKARKEIDDDNRRFPKRSE